MGKEEKPVCEEAENMSAPGSGKRARKTGPQKNELSDGGSTGQARADATVECVHYGAHLYADAVILNWD